MRSKIRPLGETDIEPVVALWTASGLTESWNDLRADIARARGSGSEEILVAVAGGQIVEGVMACDDSHRGWLYYLAVAPELRESHADDPADQSESPWLLRRDRLWPAESDDMARWLDGCRMVV